MVYQYGPLVKWSKTLASHASNMGSNPVRVTNKKSCESGFIVGAFSDEGPPVPIPNTEVKLISAENTWGAAPWEDRATPTQRPDQHLLIGFSYASIAQSVEHAAVNRGVTGSSPVGGASKGRYFGIFSFFFLVLWSFLSILLYFLRLSASYF